jgi:two-component system phosphate regulon response regulator PhoB
VDQDWEQDQRRACVLVAEDHGDSRDAMRALLEAFGFDVLLAENGRDAVRLASDCNPDVILMDIMMPEVDGLEATRRIRAGRSTRGIPIIAVTAMEGARNLALDAGADDCVRKPVEIRRLIDKLRTLLAGR